MELSTRFAGITTSPRARDGGVPAMEAIKKAKANLRYIDRRSAASSACAFGPLQNPDGTSVRSRSQARTAMRRAIEARAAKGGKNGTRVAEKIMFSLPNDFAGRPAKEALARILKRLTGDSAAVAYGVIHTDRPDNLHCHVLAVDGAESVASAQKRRPKAKRVRRQDHLRMNERGRPKTLRGLIATEINAVAARYGLTKVEHRSFKDRNISCEPGTHLGPQQIARTARETEQRIRQRPPFTRTPRERGFPSDVR